MHSAATCVPGPSGDSNDGGAGVWAGTGAHLLTSHGAQPTPTLVTVSTGLFLETQQHSFEWASVHELLKLFEIYDCDLLN